jgi:hypothetical protein
VFHKLLTGRECPVQCPIVLVFLFAQVLCPVWRQGPCGGGPFCDHPSGPLQYFSTELPIEIQVLGSGPAEIPVFVNFSRREVCTDSLSRHYCNSTLGYGRQVLMPTKKKNSPPADRRRLPAMAFGRWISTTKID